MSGHDSGDQSHGAWFEVVNRLGLHARAATLLAKTACQFAASITVRKDTESVDAKSVLELMLLEATRGTKLEVVAVGPDAIAAVAAIGDLIQQGFYEND